MQSYHNNNFHLLELRQNIRGLCIPCSLHALWCYSQCLVFNKEPKQIEIANESLLSENYIDRISIVDIWELELISREILFGGCLYGECSNAVKISEGIGPHSLRERNAFIGVLKNMKDVTTKIEVESLKNDGIEKYFTRLAHQRFVVQNFVLDKYRIDYIMRYFKIFNNEKINKDIEKILGINVKELYLIGILFFARYDKFSYCLHSDIYEDLELKKHSITYEKYKIFLHLFSKDMDDIRKVILEEIKQEENFLYETTALKAFPIIKVKYNQKDCLFCPIPLFLLMSFTSGLYYKVYQNDNGALRSKLGYAFENYIGDVIKKQVKNNKFLKHISETHYKDGKNKKATTDHILYDDDTIIFIETKIKRMNHKSITRMNSKSVSGDMKIFVDSVVQVCSRVGEWKNGKWKNIKYNSNLKPIILIVALEELFLSEENMNCIQSLAKSKLNKNGMNFEDFSFHFISSYHLEVIMLETKTNKLKNIAQKIELKQLGYGNILKKESLWKDEFDDFFKNN